jgi:acyl carrier protein
VTVVDDSAERRQKMIQFLIDFVIEQTGYPEDIVTVDAELEADLGIDSIKIAQMIGELNDYFHLNVAALRETSADRYKTIASIVEVVLSVEAGESASVVIERESGRAPEEGIAKQVVDQPNVLLQSSGVNARDLKKFLVDFVIEQTGYPEDIVTLDADLEADLGIDSIKIAQMMGEMNDHFGLSINDYKGRTMDDFKSLDAIISHLTQKS